MGLTSSGSTVNVQAFLTDKGKQKIYNAIETGSASGFITKFGVGDSDANYKSIDSGYGNLASGHVPEGSDYDPAMRSYVLYKGAYRPGVPVILIGEDYGPEITLDMSIGANNERTFITFNVGTEWPKNSVFEEGHKVAAVRPSWMSESMFKRLFTVAPLPNGEHAIQFNGDATEDELDSLLGTNRTGSSTIQLNVTGTLTNQTAIIYVEVRQ